MAPTDPTTTQSSNEPAIAHAIRQQLQSHWHDVLPAAEQDHAVALLCDDPVMQAYFERAGLSGTALAAGR